MDVEVLALLEDNIVKHSPLQGAKVRKLFQSMDQPMRDSLGVYIKFFLAQGESIEYLAKSYAMLVKETLKEQMYFAKNGCYRYKTYQEVSEKVYNNKEYMRMYMIGLCISTVLWENHRKIFSYFVASFLKQNRSSERGYLEIGPGHGFFLMEAMKYTNYQLYHAVDISETSVNMTKEILTFFAVDHQYKIECLDFLHMTATLQYDAIVMGEVLEHVENPLEFLRKISEFANNDTKIYISTCINAPEIDHIFLFSALSDIEDLFEKTGLKVKDKLILPYKNETLESSFDNRLPINLAYILQKE